MQRLSNALILFSTSNFFFSSNFYAFIFICFNCTYILHLTWYYHFSIETIFIFFICYSLHFTWGSLHILIFKKRLHIVNFIFCCVLFCGFVKCTESFGDSQNGTESPPKTLGIEQSTTLKFPYDQPCSQLQPLKIYIAFQAWLLSHQFSSVQSLSHVQPFVTPWIASRQASLSSTNSRSLLKLMSIRSVMPSSHLILCRPLLLLPQIPPSISLFQWVHSSHQVAKVLEFQLQHQSFQWTPRTDLL